MKIKCNIKLSVIITFLLFIGYSNNLFAQPHCTITPTSTSFTYSGGSATFTVNSSIGWTVRSLPGWISASPVSGSGNGSFTLTCSANTSQSSNNGTVVAGALGGFLTNISVTQAAAPPSLTVSPTSLSLPYTSGSTTISITSNVSWNITYNGTIITGANPPWSSNNCNVTIYYGANTSQSSKSDNIKITGGGLTQTISVTQAGAPPSLTVSPTSLSLPYTSGNTAFSITSNVNWSISYSGSIISSISTSSGANNAYVTVNYNTNSSQSSINGSITVSGGGISQTISVTQAGAPPTLTISNVNTTINTAPTSATVTYTINQAGTVYYYLDNSQVNTTVYNAGTYSYTYTGLTAGTHILSISISNSNGNGSDYKPIKLNINPHIYE
jgi:Viral BACON domain